MKKITLNLDKNLSHHITSLKLSVVYYSPMWKEPDAMNVNEAISS